MSDSLPKRNVTLGGGRYVLTDRLDDGGLHGIFLGFDRKLHQWCAVRVLGPDGLADRSVRARFEQEAAALAAVDHPRVVGLLDQQEDGATSFLVMHLAAGGTAIGWMENHGAMPAALAARVAADVAEGLAALHEAGWAHGDLSPISVLFEESGAVRLGQLHYATPLDEAPELEAGDRQALGRLLYTLLTGHAPTELSEIDHAALPPPLDRVVANCIGVGNDYLTTNALWHALRSAADLLGELPRGLPPLAYRPPLMADPPETAEGLDYRSAPRDVRYDLPHHRGLTPGLPPRVAPPALLNDVTPPPGDRHPTPTALPYVLPERPKRSQREEIERRMRQREALRRGGATVDDGDEDLPSYAVATPAPAPERDLVITPEPVHRSAAPAPTRAPTPRPASPRSSPSGAPRRTPGPAAPRLVQDPNVGEVIEDEEAPEVGEPLPEGRLEVVRASAEPSDGPTVPVAALAAVLGATALVTVLGILLMVGSASVTEASVSALNAQAELIAAVEAHHQVIEELRNLGNDTRQLEQAYFQFKDAADGERARHAGAFAREVVALTERSARGAGSAQAMERARILGKASETAETTHQRWVEVASSPSGWLSTTLGLCRGPG